MLLGCGCLLAFAAAFAPRLVLIFMWIFGWRIQAAFDTWIWPLLGIIFLPYTTIMYVLVWTPATGISGWDWLWIGLGVLLDIMKWGQIANNRKGIPYYPEGAY
jgi:hypothetical protein